MLRSLFAVFLGMFVSLVIGMLVLFGIVAPLFEEFVPPRLAQTSGLPAGIVLFAAAFALYFGGMAAGYRAPSRRRLHGVAVAVALFLLSPALNFVVGQEALPQLQSAGSAVLALAVVVVSVMAAYVGASRGASLHAYNEGHRRRRRVRQRTKDG